MRHPSQFPGTTISDMCSLFKPILKRNPEYLILHIGTKDTSNYTPNGVVNKISDLKSFVESNAEKCKAIILTLTVCVGNQKLGNVVRKVNDILIYYAYCKNLQYY